MDCEKAMGWLNNHIDGTLGAEEAESVENHLRECEGCRTEATALRALVEEAGSLPESIEPARDLWPVIRSRIAEEKRTPAHVRRFWAIPHRRLR